MGKAISLVAEYFGKPGACINIYPNSTWGALGGKGYPEIARFGVLAKCQNQDVGTTLMDIAEQIAVTYTDIVYLGVGLHSGYGSAQRMYVKCGYIPGGSGVWYQDKMCMPYEECKTFALHICTKSQIDNLRIYAYTVSQLHSPLCA